MKKILVALVCMIAYPMLSMAQDDLYFVPKKKTETKSEKTAAKVVVKDKKAPTKVYSAPGTQVAVKDVKGNVRDVDEYNRRYTSRENNFSIENDTLYIEEKPVSERGEWVNGFDGSQEDYEYAMRIVRFRNPRYAVHVSSPYYWEIVHMLPSWEWNVYDDGLYAYAFPTYSNPYWWDWKWSYPYGSYFSLNFNFHSPWYYSWYGPSFWYGGYWGYHPYHWHHHHHGPLYAGIGGYWGGGHRWYGSSAMNPGKHAGRYVNNYARNSNTARREVAARGEQNRTSATRQNVRNDRNTTRSTSVRTDRKTTTGRVVTSRDGSTSVRPTRTVQNGERSESSGNRNATSTTTRSSNSYNRSAQGKGSSYDRPSSTRSSVTKGNNATSYQRKSTVNERNRTVNSSGSTRSNSSYSGSSSSRSSSGSSFSSGSSSSRSSSGGGSSSRSSGGGSRGRR